MESWRSVVGYVGLYEVSDYGRVRSLFGRGRIMALCPSAGGHLSLRLSDGKGNSRGFQIHRLVLEAFVGPCPEGMECRHLNDDPTDNRLENLVWGTRSENHFDRVRNGIHHQTRKTHCPKGHHLESRPLYERHRWCPICHKLAQRRAKEKKRETNRAKTVCPQGHELVEMADGRKQCPTCKGGWTRHALDGGREDRRLAQLAQTHCKRGHEFTPENTYRYQGRRVCRACSAEKTARYRERKAAG